MKSLNFVLLFFLFFSFLSCKRSSVSNTKALDEHQLINRGKDRIYLAVKDAEPIELDKKSKNGPEWQTALHKYGVADLFNTKNFDVFLERKIKEMPYDDPIDSNLYVIACIDEPKDAAACVDEPKGGTHLSGNENFAFANKKTKDSAGNCGKGRIRLNERYRFADFPLRREDRTGLKVLLKDPSPGECAVLFGSPTTANDMKDLQAAAKKYEFDWWKDGTRLGFSLTGCGIGVGNGVANLIRAIPHAQKGTNLYRIGSILKGLKVSKKVGLTAANFAESFARIDDVILAYVIKMTNKARVLASKTSKVAPGVSEAAENISKYALHSIMASMKENFVGTFGESGLAILGTVKLSPKLSSVFYRYKTGDTAEKSPNYTLNEAFELAEKLAGVDGTKKGELLFKEIAESSIGKRTLSYLEGNGVTPTQVAYGALVVGSFFVPALSCGLFAMDAHDYLTDNRKENNLKNMAKAVRKSKNDVVQFLADRNHELLDEAQLTYELMEDSYKRSQLSSLIRTGNGRYVEEEQAIELHDNDYQKLDLFARVMNLLTAKKFNKTDFSKEGLSFDHAMFSRDAFEQYFQEYTALLKQLDEEVLLLGLTQLAGKATANEVQALIDKAKKSGVVEMTANEKQDLVDVVNEMTETVNEELQKNEGVSASEIGENE